MKDRFVYDSNDGPQTDASSGVRSIAIVCYVELVCADHERSQSVPRTTSRYVRQNQYLFHETSHRTRRSLFAVAARLVVGLRLTEAFLRLMAAVFFPLPDTIRLAVTTLFFL